MLNSVSCPSLFSSGFPTNRIQVIIPSTGQEIVLRETTVVELKSLCKTVIDNLGRKQMDVLYDAVTEYLQAMVLVGDIDFRKVTEYDRLFVLMLFFHVSFYKDSTTVKCPGCGGDVVYRYDLSRYLAGMDMTNGKGAFVQEQHVEYPSFKGRDYGFVLSWPTVEEMSSLMHAFYANPSSITEKMEQTQFGTDFVLNFVKKIELNGETVAEFSNATSFQDKKECLNSLPSVIVYDGENGLIAKIMGMFINRLENCFGFEQCPYCKSETYFGLGQSAHFQSMFYGSLSSIYAFVANVECLLLYRYDCCIFDKEQYMTYNDLQTLVHQISTTTEKENEERRKNGNNHFMRGLWFIRQILNHMVFPGDKHD